MSFVKIGIASLAVPFVAMLLGCGKESDNCMAGVDHCKVCDASNKTCATCDQEYELNAGRCHAKGPAPRDCSQVENCT